MCLKQLDVNKITFVDEKRFLLDGPDGYRYYWHKFGTDRRVFGKKAFSGGLTVWAGIGFGGTTTKTINSEKYQEIIQQHYLPFHQPGFLLAATFQQFQDNLWQKETLRYCIGQHIFPTVILSRTCRKF